MPLGNIFDTLQVYLGSVYVNDFNRFGRTFQVRAQAEGDFRAEPERHRAAQDAQRRRAAWCRSARSLDVAVAERPGPRRALQHVPGRRGATATPRRAAARARRMATMERLAGADAAARASAIEWTDIAYQAKLAGNTALFIFPLCVLFVFLVHSAEYESWSLPLAIILIAPMCLPFALARRLARAAWTTT